MAPHTELDARFSDAGAKPTSWADTEKVLASAQLFWISTVRRDGRPHVTPLVAVWRDDALHFSTGAQEQKGVNLASNPEVVLSTGDLRWDGGLDVMVEGVAERVTDDGELELLAQDWARKWDGQWRFEVIDGGFREPGGGDDPRGSSTQSVASVYRVRPRKVLIFGKGGFTHTRHVF